MKRLLILFGLLDVVILFRSFGLVKTLAFDMVSFPLIAIGDIFTYSSMILSAYFLVTQSKVGLWLTYGQFPFRILFMILSFGFLSKIVRFNIEQVEYLILMWFIVGLEIGRLICTIYIHRKYYLKNAIPALH